MDLGIQNKVALVAASSSGLGKAAALQLSREGTKVAICARNEANLKKAREDIAAETGGIVQAYTADVTQRDQVKQMVADILSSLGSIDILVCNAGGPPAGFVDDFSPEDYLKAVELNLMSTISLCYEAVPHMKKKGWGRIVCVVSVSAKQPIPNLVLSNTARAGVLGFAKSLSEQVAPYGITVNSICPGYTQTERVDDLAQSYANSGKGTKQDFYATIAASIPMNRMGTTEEFAHTVAFLASEGAGYITGAALQVDGGYIKGLF
jgi:3-oxoacyl-[acyl-carrier protein] reductase